MSTDPDEWSPEKTILFVIATCAAFWIAVVLVIDYVFF